MTPTPAAQSIFRITRSFLIMRNYAATHIKQCSYGAQVASIRDFLRNHSYSNTGHGGLAWITGLPLVLRQLEGPRCATIRAMFTDRLFARSARPSGPRAELAPSRWHHGPWWSNSYLLTPLLSILVFLVVMSLILWSLNRREQQQQEDTLYRNVAWAQQQIRLSMTGAQEQLQALARDLAAGRADPHSFQMSTADIMQGHPEILYLNWYTSPQQPRWPNTPLPVFGQRLPRPTPRPKGEAATGGVPARR